MSFPSTAIRGTSRAANALARRRHTGATMVHVRERREVHPARDADRGQVTLLPAVWAGAPSDEDTLCAVRTPCHCHTPGPPAPRHRHDRPAPWYDTYSR